jgi:hypothetical protein
MQSAHQTSQITIGIPKRGICKRKRKQQVPDSNILFFLIRPSSSIREAEEKTKEKKSGKIKHDGDRSMSRKAVNVDWSKSRPKMVSCAQDLKKLDPQPARGIRRVLILEHATLKERVRGHLLRVAGRLVFCDAIIDQLYTL